MRKDLIKTGLAMSQAGLVNNPNVCIKDMGSSFACVCEPCMTAFQAYVEEFGSRFFPDPSPTNQTEV